MAEKVVACLFGRGSPSVIDKINGGLVEALITVRSAMIFGCQGLASFFPSECFYMDELHLMPLQQPCQGGRDRENDACFMAGETKSQDFMWFAQGQNASWGVSVWGRQNNTSLLVSGPLWQQGDNEVLRQEWEVARLKKIDL